MHLSPDFVKAEEGVVGQEDRWVAGVDLGTVVETLGPEDHNSLAEEVHKVQNLDQDRSHRVGLDLDRSRGRIVEEDMVESPVGGSLAGGMAILDARAVVVKGATSSGMTESASASNKNLRNSERSDARSEGRQRKYPHGFAHSEQVCD